MDFNCMCSCRALPHCTSLRVVIFGACGVLFIIFGRVFQSIHCRLSALLQRNGCLAGFAWGLMAGLPPLGQPAPRWTTSLPLD